MKHWLALVIAIFSFACGAHRPARPPVLPRPVLSKPEFIARGVVGVKDVNDGWRVDLFMADGQRWSFHNEHLFYHVHVGQMVRVSRYGVKLLFEIEEEK